MQFNEQLTGLTFNTCHDNYKDTVLIEKDTTGKEQRRN